MNRKRIGHDWEFGFNEPVVVLFSDKEVAVRRLADGRWHAFSKNCPHQGADLSQVDIIDGTLKCPWHGLCFDTATGNNLTNECSPMDVFAISVVRGEVFLSEVASEETVVRTYLCRYGWDRRTGRFKSLEDVTYAKGDKCVGRTARGIERLTILNESSHTIPGNETGTITGTYHPEHHHHEDLRLKLTTHLENTFQAQQLDTEILHIEVLIDQQVIVHYIGFDQKALGPLCVSTSHQLGISISFCRAEFGNGGIS